MSANRCHIKRHTTDAAAAARYPACMTTDLQRQVSGAVEEALGERRRSFFDRDPEYRALRMLASRNRKHPPRTPTDALQHVVDVARQMTEGTYGALAVTGETDYVEGFMVSGMDEKALDTLKGPPQGHGPLGSMRQDGLPIHIDDVSRHAKAFGFPPRHPEMKALLGVPIIASGRVRGALYVTDRKHGKPFTDEDRGILNVLAHHAALIIDASWY
jgi:GAF domain-containing protein